MKKRDSQSPKKGRASLCLGRIVDNVLLDGEAKIKVDVPFSERKNLGRWPSMDFSDLPPSSENPTAKNLQESILEREGVKPRVMNSINSMGHLPSPEEMEQYEDPGSFNMEEEHVSVSPNMVAIHMRHLYRVMRCFRFFICRVVTPDGHIRSFNLRECMSERKLKGKPDPHDRYKIILMDTSIKRISILELIPTRTCGSYPSSIWHMMLILSGWESMFGIEIF